MEALPPLTCTISTELMSPRCCAITPVNWWSTPGPSRACTITPTLRRVCSSAMFNLVLRQDFIPVSLRLQQQYGGFTDGSRAADGLGSDMRNLLHFGPCIGDSDPEADTPHDDDVGEIVADECDLFGIQTGMLDDVPEYRDFLDVTLIAVGHVPLLGPHVHHCRLTSADDAGLDTVPMQPLERNAILRIEAFRFSPATAAIGDVINHAVRQDAIHIHEQELDARCALDQRGIHV